MPRSTPPCLRLASKRCRAFSLVEQPLLVDPPPRWRLALSLSLPLSRNATASLRRDSRRRGGIVHHPHQPARPEGDEPLELSDGVHPRLQPEQLAGPLQLVRNVQEEYPDDLFSWGGRVGAEQGDRETKGKRGECKVRSVAHHTCKGGYAGKQALRTCAPRAGI